MAEFEEIAHSGGKIELLWSNDGEGVAIRFSHSAPFGCALFQVRVTLDGKRMAYVPTGGVDSRPPPPPVPVVTTFVISDREQMFGRTCPQCNTYFRTNTPSEVMQCPYCSHEDANVAFSTKNQLRFIDAIRQAYAAAFERRASVTIDLNQVADGLESNKPAWLYSEEKQQNRFACPSCGAVYDILGEYAGCPSCGKRNSLQVFDRYAAQVRAAFEKADAALSDRHEREVEWEKLTRCISDFEAMARDVQSQLVRFPTSPRRRSEMISLSFQNILKANDCLKRWFGFEILDGMSDDDKTFLNRMFNRRHVLTHNGGRIDQEYLDNTGDTTVRLNQKISVHSKEIRRLLGLLRACAMNLFVGFESIT